MVMMVALASAGCGDDHGHTHASPGEDACEHLEGGPVRSITAGADAASAVDASESHTRYDVTLPAVGGPAGFLEVAIAQAGEHVIFVDEDVTIVISDATGTPVTATRAVGDADCDLVAVAYTVDLGVGTYTLAITPASAATTSASLVIVAHEEHEH